MDFLSGLLGVAGWLVVVVILFRAWRRFPNRESRLALIGTLLVLGSTALILVVGTILRVQAPSRSDLGVTFYLLGLPRLVGLVGTVMLVYAYWLIVMRAAAIPSSQRKDEM